MKDSDSGRIMINLNTGSKTLKLEIDKGTSLVDIVKSYQADLPFIILAAKVNNKMEELHKRIYSFSEVQLLDMRDNATNFIYQRSATVIFIKAVEEALGSCGVHVENSLNQGLYIEINGGQKLPQSLITKIENRMREIVKEDIPYVLEMNTKDPKNAGMSTSVYSCGGTKEAYNGQLVPSTRYIQLFELKKYGGGVIIRFPDPKSPDRMPEYRDDKKLYGAFKEATEWGKLMGISLSRDLNEKIASGEYKQIIQISEALHEKKIAQIADLIVKKGKRIILISGATSSGKTTFANRLCIQLRVNGKRPIYLGTDDYFVERSETPIDENGNMNFEDIEGIDLTLFNGDMNALLKGEIVDLPTFDFKLGAKIFGNRITKAEEDQPIVIEGIHGLNQKLTEFIPDDQKFKIYVGPFTQINIDAHNRIPTTDARMIRRIVRDFKFRNYSAQKTISSWPSVRKGEDKNIFPFSEEADVLMNTAHIYELAVLKKYAFPLLSAITQEEPEFSEAIRMLRFIKHFDSIEDDSIIANNSVLREFIGGSIFLE